MYPGEADWDVAVWPHLQAGGTISLLWAGLSHIPDNTASPSQAFSGDCAMIQFFLSDSPLASGKCFLISNLSVLS